MRIAWFPVIAAIMLFGFAMWSIRSVLGPVTVTVGLFFLLWPYRGVSAVRQVMIVTALAMTVWILVQARAIVYPTLAALALAFLLDPAVDRLNSRGIRRSLAALSVMLPILGLGAILALVGIPLFVNRASDLISRIPDLYRYLVDWLDPIIRSLTQSESPLLPRDLSALLPSADRVVSNLLAGLVQVGRGLKTVLNLAAFLILTPVLTYYILVDFDRLRATTRPYIPPVYLERLRTFGAIFQESVAAWLKGQLLVALVVGSLSLGGLYAIGYPYALVVGVLAGLLNLIPVIGFWTTFTIALVGCLFAPDPWGMTLRVTGVLLAVQLLEQNLLSPRIVGKHLGVNPVILMITMLGLSIFLGILGVFLAPPAIGIARAAWAIWIRPYRREPDATAPTPR